MKYKFSSFLNIDYSELKRFVPRGRELTKEELVERCSGEISAELLKAIKAIEFSRIGIDEELYIV